MTFLIAATSSYHLGQDTAFATLIAGLIWCLLRAVRVLPRRAPAATGGADIAPSVQPTAEHVTGSMAPPGFASARSISSATDVSTRTAPKRIDWRFGAAALLLTVLLAATAMRTTGAHDSPWETGIGAQMKTGFIAGCTNTGANAAHCGCVFSRLTAHPPYNTPDGFASLATNEQEFERTHDVNALPQAYIDAVGACRTTE